MAPPNQLVYEFHQDKKDHGYAEYELLSVEFYCNVCVDAASHQTSPHSPKVKENKLRKDWSLLLFYDDFPQLQKD
jgi:hypothetical protein